MANSSHLGSASGAGGSAGALGPAGGGGGGVQQQSLGSHASTRERMYDHRPLGAHTVHPSSVASSSSVLGHGAGQGGLGPSPNISSGIGGPDRGERSAPIHASAPPGMPIGPGQVVAVGPGGVPVQMAAVSGGPPTTLYSSARLNDLLEFVKQEFEQVAGETGGLRAAREEYEAMINHHGQEINAMRSIAYDLERKHHEDKRSLAEDNARLQDENQRLRRELESRSSSFGSGTGPSSALPQPHPPPNLSNGPSLASHSRLPPMDTSGRPPSASGGPIARPGTGGFPAYGDREHAGASNGERENKRQRLDLDDGHAIGNGKHQKGGYPTKAPMSSLAAPNPISRSISHNSPSTSDAATASPTPTYQSSNLHTTEGPSPLNVSAPTPMPAMVEKDRAPDKETESSLVEKESTSTPAIVPAAGSSNGATSTAVASTSNSLKKEGSDWLTMFNPNVKRVLDVGLVHTLVHESVVCCVRFSPDGKILATGCNRNTTLYDTRTGARITVFIDETVNSKADNYVRSATFSPDGKFLATGSEDRIIRIWNVTQRRISKVFQGHKSEIYSLAFSPDGKKLVSGSGDKTARIWDMDSGACLHVLPVEEVIPPPTTSPSPPGLPEVPVAVDAGVTSVVVSPDGKYLAAGSLDMIVRIWDVASGVLLDRLKGHKDSVYSVAFSPDGKFLVSGSLDKTLKMWDMNSLRAAITAAGSVDGKPKEASLTSETKTFCMTTLHGHKDYVLSVDISPDGAWIVSGSKDRGVQFWDPMTAKAQFMLQGHKNSVISVAVSGVGGLVATGSGDWTARIWSYEKLQ